MPRYKERSREQREDREDRRRHDTKRRGRPHEDAREESTSDNRDRSRSNTSSFGHDRRNQRSSRNERNARRRSSFEEAVAKKEPSPEWGRCKAKNEDKSPAKPAEKEKPNFALSGKLTEDTNMVNGVVIKYSEPQDARKPKRRWRLYPFKGEKALPTLYVHRQSAYLMGRDRKIADIPLDHPSCSKQHAALQYRLVTFQRDNGSEGKRLRPYLIDLESANGTFVNNVKLEPKRFHELLERDVLKFGFSSREYVLLHEHSRDDALDDDVTIPSTSET